MSYPSYQPENPPYAVPGPPPGYPPPGAGQPAGAEPTQPVPPQPMPPQHASGYPMQPPISAPATPGFPNGAMPDPGAPYAVAPARRSSTTTTLVLALVAGLLFVLGGVAFGLYFDKRGEVRDTRATLATRTSELQTQQRLVAEQTAKTAQVEKRANDLNGQLTRTKSSLADTTKERTALEPCMRRIQEMFQALRDNSLSRATRALNRAETACDRAETALDS